MRDPSGHRVKRTDGLQLGSRLVRWGVGLLGAALVLLILSLSLGRYTRAHCENAIARALEHPSGDNQLPFLTIEATGDVVQALSALPPYESIECFDYISWNLAGHDWDCEVVFVDGQRTLVRSILSLTMLRQTVRF